MNRLTLASSLVILLSLAAPGHTAACDSLAPKFCQIRAIECDSPEEREFLRKHAQDSILRGLSRLHVPRSISFGDITLWEVTSPDLFTATPSGPFILPESYLVMGQPGGDLVALNTRPWSRAPGDHVLEKGCSELRRFNGLITHLKKHGLVLTSQESIWLLFFLTCHYQLRDTPCLAAESDGNDLQPLSKKPDTQSHCADLTLGRMLAFGSPTISTPRVHGCITTDTGGMIISAVFKEVEAPQSTNTGVATQPVQTHH